MGSGQAEDAGTRRRRRKSGLASIRRSASVTFILDHKRSKSRSATAFLNGATEDSWAVCIATAWHRQCGCALREHG